MTIHTNDKFYTRLPVNELPLSELLNESHLFFTVPDNWIVVITDVKNSTKAAADGLHQTVNLVATGSIVAVLNIAFKKDITIPFFFGGDGATFIIPPNMFDTALVALQQHHKNVLQSFGLEMRVGHVTVSEIYSHTHSLRISKVRASPLLYIPIVLGDGLSFAEKKIKASDYIPASIADDEEGDLDMSGMQCRWDKINPPTSENEIISLLVIAENNTTQATVFAEVMNRIDAIFGSTATRSPITVQKLKLLATLKKIGDEMRTRFGKEKIGYLIKTWLTTLIGKLYFKTNKGKDYLNKLVDLSDTLVIDGRINTVISGTPTQRIALVSVLDQLEKEGKIIYGLHVSKASIMSCYVRNMGDDHIHFVDGDDGGYTRAATMLKTKLKRVSTN